MAKPPREDPLDLLSLSDENEVEDLQVSIQSHPILANNSSNHINKSVPSHLQGSLKPTLFKVKQFKENYEDFNLYEDPPMDNQKVARSISLVSKFS